jgi:hypothetical protein
VLSQRSRPDPARTATITDAVRAHQARCLLQLVTLRMLARDPDEAPHPAGLAVAVGDAVGAIMTEAETAGRAMMRASAGHGSAGYRSLLAARLDRLDRAALEVVTSARDGDTARLRGRLQRFDAMATAMWTVQLSAARTARSGSR